MTVQRAPSDNYSHIYSLAGTLKLLGVILSFAGSCSFVAPWYILANSSIQSHLQALWSSFDLFVIAKGWDSYFEIF